MPKYSRLSEPVPRKMPATVAMVLFWTPVVRNRRMALIAIASSHLIRKVSKPAPSPLSNSMVSWPIAVGISVPMTTVSALTRKKTML